MKVFLTIFVLGLFAAIITAQGAITEARSTELERQDKVHIFCGHGAYPFERWVEKRKIKWQHINVRISEDDQVIYIVGNCIIKEPK